MALERVGVGVQEGVDEFEELHHALVLAEILMAFEEIGVRLTIAAAERHAARALFGLNDVHGLLKGHDADDGFAGMIGPGRRKLKVSGFFELRRNVSEVEVDKMWKLLGNFAENIIIEVPCLVEISWVLGSAVLQAPVKRLTEIRSKSLGKGYFSEC